MSGSSLLPLFDIEINIQNSEKSFTDIVNQLSSIADKDFTIPSGYGISGVKINSKILIKGTK